MWLYEQKKLWKYCFDLKLHVWFCFKIWKGVFRAHCTQIWGTSRLAFGGHMLILHYQVHGKERFPKLFSYEKLFVRFAKYQNAKRAHCTKSESTTVPKFCTDIRLFKWLIQSHLKSLISVQNLGTVVLSLFVQWARFAFWYFAKQTNNFS